MIKGLRRVSVAVHNLEDALSFYRDALGLTVTERIELPEHSLRIARLALGSTMIELMEPTDSTGPVATFIERRGEGLHHVTIDVEDIELEIRTLLARGIDLIDREARQGPDGRVAFVHPRSTGGVLVEMTETVTPTTHPRIAQATEQGTREEPDAR